jgi:ABC-type multidrug transport system permease subunit
MDILGYLFGTIFILFLIWYFGSIYVRKKRAWDRLTPEQKRAANRRDLTNLIGYSASYLAPVLVLVIFCSILAAILASVGNPGGDTSFLIPLSVIPICIVLIVILGKLSDRIK